MIQGEWFWIKKNPDAVPINGGKNFDRKNYPYFIDEETFSKIEDGVAYYKRGSYFVPCDIVFEPTFLISEKLYRLFSLLEPEMEFKGVQLYEENLNKKLPMPLYWLPYLKISDAIHEKSEIIQGKPKKLVLKSEFLAEKRILHCKLPAADIWIISLEAAECLLRRQPIGIILEQVEISE